MDPYNWEFVYPEAGYYGENLIGHKTITPELNTDYSLYVKIEGHNTVTILLPSTLKYDNNQRFGWPSASVKAGVLTFYADMPGIYDCKIRLDDENIYGKEIRIFEDIINENKSSIPKRIKIISKGGGDEK